MLIASICVCEFGSMYTALWTILSLNDENNIMKVRHEAINSNLEGKVKATGVQEARSSRRLEIPQQPDDVIRAGAVPCILQQSAVTCLRPGAQTDMCW